MYLKSIEIQGFKSFANKIKLEFQPGFTGIVGPNGSGKSNVADAVRWVLGEQRVKQLRGGSMQDVIFAGTELRKPLSFAYVAITLDNSDHALPVDYNEVTVARRLYRSGESEYLMNGVNVRLKDVQELFMDTGIGKEGYSIIGQGQIDKILSDKPEDRRELFDEAAGIVKFKHRKDQSLKKLESEQANLQRVNDILSELEKQVGPLERQAQKAQVYLKAREEQKHLDVNVFLIENEKTSKEIESLGANLEHAEADLAQTEQRFEESKEGYERVQTELDGLEHEIEDTRNAISQANIVRNKLEGDIKVYEEQIRSAKSNAAHFEDRRSSVSEEIKGREAERDKALSGKSGVDGELEKIAGSRAAAAADLAKTQEEEEGLQREIDALRDQIMDLLNSRSSIKAREAALGAKREQFELRKSELAGKLISASSDEAEHDERLRDLEAEFKRICDEVIELQNRQNEIDHNIAEKKAALTREDEALRSTEIEYHQERSKLDAVSNMAERYEGFGGAVKRVMEQKSREAGLVGVVADLIKTEAKYETAIETALGGSIQNVVTRDEDTAKRMIAMLKRDHAGRATFLPISNLSGQAGFNMMGVLREPGIIGLADTLVHIAPEYAAVAKSLLGRIVVADSFDHAAAAERKFGHKLRMVTVDGELFTPGGAISGGAFRNNSNLLGRRREIAELEKHTKALKQRMDELEASIQKTKEERNQMRAKADTVRLELQNKFMAQTAAKMSIDQEKEKKEASTAGYESLRAENDTIEDTKAALDAEQHSIAAELETSKKTEEESNAGIMELSKKLSVLRGEEEEKAAVVSRWDVEVEKVKQRQDFEQQEVDRINEELSRLHAELSEIETSIHSGDEEIEDKRSRIEEVKKTIEASHTTEMNSAALLKEKTQRKEALTAQQKRYLEDRDSLSETKANLDKEVFRLDSQKKKLEETLDAQVNYMYEEYQITLTQAMELKDESMTSLAEMKARIRELKAQIKALGSVNVNAIEEYKEVSERFTFMKTQHDDLVTAAASLEKIIEELDNNMRRQFKSQFSKIQEEFDKVFKELFGGGSGKLELMEDEDILEAGVRVIAQPPGKKLQNMMQMSGGEKALTAISLLFAIQNLKPSPFCLLDEIEAALDESNVVRFAGYIHKLTNHTQFIVITHRRGTMDRADRLYGITMQEKGVSALVSVSLIDEKDLTA